MRRRATKKKQVKKFTVKMQKNFLMVFVVMFAVFVALLVRIIIVKVTKGTEYSNAVLSHQSYKSAYLPYQRGT